MSRTKPPRHEHSRSLQALLLLLGSTLLAPHCTESPGDGGGEAGAGASAGEGGDGNPVGGSAAGEAPVGGSAAGGAPLGGSSNAGSGGGDHAGESHGGVSAVAGAPGAAGASGAGEVTGLRCVEPGEYCTASSQCGPYQRCEQGRCSDVTEGDACLPSGGGVIDCGNGLHCVDDACAKQRIIGFDEDCDAAQAAGAICPFGTECYWRPLPEFVCIDARENTGYCDAILHCKDDYYCPEDWEELGRNCLQQADVGEGCWFWEPYSCKAGLVCTLGACQPAEGPAGTPCDYGDGRFYAPYPNPCGAGLFCKMQDDPSTHLVEGVCAVGYPVGAECDHGLSCTSGICKNDGGASHCAEPVVDGPCGAAGQCPPDTLCSANSKCRPPLSLGAECTAFGDPCPIDSVCTSAASTGTKHCTALAGPDEECSMAVCGHGQICIDPTSPG